MRHVVPPDTVPFSVGGCRGLVLREAALAIRAHVLPDPMAAAKAGRVLRPSVSRLTSRVSLGPSGAALLKVHRVRSLGERLLSCVRGGRARQEWRASRYLGAAGLPVPPALALGEARRLGMLRGSFFAARFLPGLRPAHEALDGQPPDKRDALLERLAVLVRAMHDRGFDHRDLHSGNVLAGPGPGDECQVVLVDLHRSRLGVRVGAAARARALARWLHSLAGLLDSSARVAWLARYCGSEEEARALLPGIERRMARLERVRRASRGKRCLKESTVYTLDVGRGRGARRRDLALGALDAALAAHDRAADPQASGFLKRSRKGRVTRHDGIVVKERCPTSLISRLRDRLAPARHAAGYRNAHMLGVLGVGTARPLAWVRRDGRVFTLYEDLSTRTRLDHLARDLHARGGRAEQVRLREASAAWLGRLHREGIYHGDLKGVNVLVDPVSMELALIDTDACRFFGQPVDDRRRVKNLAQLAASIPRSVTRTERLRWYRRYAEALGVHEDVRRVAKAVAEALKPKIVVVDEPIE